MHLALSRLAFTEWQEVVTCERITKASFLSLAPPYPPFSSLFLILTLKRPLLSQSGPHLVTHAWNNKLNWNLSESFFVFTPWIRLGSHSYVCIQSHDGKTSYGLEKLTEPNCFFVFVFKLGKVQSKRLNKEDLQSWWQDFDCLFCYLALPPVPPTVRKSSLGAGMSLPTARVQIVNLLQTWLKDKSSWFWELSSTSHEDCRGVPRPTPPWGAQCQNPCGIV